MKDHRKNSVLINAQGPLGRILLCICISLISTTLSAKYIDFYFSDSLLSDLMAFDRKTYLASETNGVYLDGLKSDLTTEVESFEQSLMSRSRIRGGGLRGEWGLSGGISTDSERLNEGQDSTEGHESTERRVSFKTDLALSYFLNAESELTGGLYNLYMMHSTKNLSNETSKTVEDYAAINYNLPFVAYIKRGALFQLGVKYQWGEKSKRKITQKNSLEAGEKILRATVGEPPSLGLILGMGGARAWNIVGEFESFDASDWSPKALDDSRIYDDYFKAAVKLAWQFDSHSTSFRMAYQSSSYAEQRKIAMLLIPTWLGEFRLRLLRGPLESYFSMGYGRAKDRQSLREFNADYSLGIYSLGAGFLLRL